MDRTMQEVNSCWGECHLLAIKKRKRSVPRFRQLLLWKWSPYRILSLLLLKPAPEHFFYVSHGESTDRWSWNTVEAEIYLHEVHVWMGCYQEASLFPAGRRGSPVHLRGEYPHYRRNPVNVDDVSDGLKHVKVEERLPRHRTIQSGLHKRCPVLLQHPLRSADVILANPGHAGIHNLAAEEGGSWVNVTITLKHVE